MTQIRLLSIVVLLLLVSSIEVCDAATRKTLRMMQRVKKQTEAPKAAETTETPLTGVDGGDNPIDGALNPTTGKTLGTEPDAAGNAPGPGAGVVTPVGVVTPIGGMHPNAPAYAGFFCGPPEKGEQGIMEKCNILPVCHFKRIDDGPNGKKITSELEEGQGDCMRRCDTRFGLSEEVNCGPGEKCHSFIMGCSCPNLTDEACHPYKN